MHAGQIHDTSFSVKTAMQAVDGEPLQSPAQDQRLELRIQTRVRSLKGSTLRDQVSVFHARRSSTSSSKIMNMRICIGACVSENSLSYRKCASYPYIRE